MVKRSKKVAVWLFMFMVAFVFVGGNTNEVQAASKVKYSYKKVDKTKTFYNGKSVAKVYFEKTVLKGKSKAVKKINKAISDECNRFLSSSSVDSVYDYSKSDGEYGRYDTYRYCADSDVTYNKNGVISIMITSSWYAGGVSNTEIYGMTFSLKTGKRLYLTDVCSGSEDNIKQRVVNKIRKGPEADSVYWNVVNAYKTKDLNFYLKPNKKAVVCFAPYEINYGGWSRYYTIQSQYK